MEEKGNLMITLQAVRHRWLWQWQALSVKYS